MTLSDLEEETEKSVKSFYNYQKQEKGLSKETASEHAHQIGFFANNYLTGYEEKRILEVTGIDIKDYLGNWYIRKVWNSSKSDVRPILVAFKKFYKFLHESAEDELSSIIGAVVYLFSVFEERIFPALTIFGLLDFGFKKDRRAYLVNRGWGIEWFTVTQLGEKIFRGIR